MIWSTVAPFFGTAELLLAFPGVAPGLDALVALRCFRRSAECLLAFSGMAPGFDAWELRSFFRASECLLEFAETAPGVVAIAPLRFFSRSAESREDLAVDPRPDL